jgi:hypothetical protein
MSGPLLLRCTGLTCYHDSRRLVRAIKVINFEQTAAYQGAHFALALGRGLPCLVHF